MVEVLLVGSGCPCGYEDKAPPPGWIICPYPFWLGLTYLIRIDKSIVKDIFLSSKIKIKFSMFKWYLKLTDLARLIEVVEPLMYEWGAISTAPLGWASMVVDPWNPGIYTW